MESKHFSHHHPLAFHQVNPGSHTHCSGCNSPASGNVYVCWQCSYFLHEHCFRATRSLRHPTHPLHPLSLVPFPTYPSATFFCNTCSLSGDGFSYSCSACDFDIHLHCALTPNLNPNNPNTSYPNPSLAPPHDYNINPHPQNPLYPPPNSNSNPIQPYPPQPQPPPNPNPIQPYPPQTQHLQNQNQTQNYAPTGYPQTQEQYPPTAYPQPNPPPQNYAPPPNPPQPQPNPPPPIYSTVTTAAATTPPPQPPPPPQTGSPQPKPNSSIIKHFSHPHVLKQMEIEKSKAKVCSACECELSGAAYCCTEGYCTFNLHKACFDSPQEVRHKSHLEHPLKLLAAPPYSDGFTCNACLKDGKAFCYNCADCSYDLHIDCVQWPDTVRRPDHDHDLTLYYSSPAQAAADSSTETVFMCDVCNNPVHEMAWVYFCRECDFGTHLECVASGIKQQSGGSAEAEDELLREVELKFAVLQLLLAAQGRKAAIDII